MMCAKVIPFVESGVILRSFCFLSATLSSQVYMDSKTLGDFIQVKSHILCAEESA